MSKVLTLLFCDGKIETAGKYPNKLKLMCDDDYGVQSECNQCSETWFAGPELAVKCCKHIQFEEVYRGGIYVIDVKYTEKEKSNSAQGFNTLKKFLW